MKKHKNILFNDMNFKAEKQSITQQSAVQVKPKPFIYAYNITASILQFISKALIIIIASIVGSLLLTVIFSAIQQNRSFDVILQETLLNVFAYFN